MTWGLTQEKQKGVMRWVIKRWNPEKGCPERLAIEQYRHIRDDEKELRALVKRLNAPQDAKKSVAFRHAFIDDALIEQYRDYLRTRIRTPSVVTTNINYLKNYVLNYFVGHLGVKNPNDWKRYETEWAGHLLYANDHKLSEEDRKKYPPKAAKTKRDIIIEANRFLSWLSEKREDEIKFKKLEPLTKEIMKSIDAERELKGETFLRKLVTDADWKTIKAKLPKDIHAQAMLAYHYGLRRAETLGLLPQDVKKGRLIVERQLFKLGEFKHLKGKSARKVDHWFSTPSQTFKWVEQVQENQMHPCTVTDRWNAVMDQLQLDYDFHDLRHTFITKAIRKYNARDVQLAAGHKHISTTMTYLHDDREDADEQFVPEKD